MKYLLILLFLLTPHIVVLAQERHYFGGAANLFSYTDKEGVNETNIGVVFVDAMGRAYMQAYTGNLYIIGNNYSKKIVYPDSAKTSALFSSGQINDAVILFGNNHMYQLQQDTIASIWKYPDGAVNAFVQRQAIYCNTFKNALFTLYEFKENKFVKVAEKKVDKEVTMSYAYPTLDGGVFTADIFANKMILSAINENFSVVPMAELPLNNGRYYILGTDKNNFLYQTDGASYIFKEGKLSRQENFSKTMLTPVIQSRKYAFVTNENGVYSLIDLQPKPKVDFSVFSEDRISSFFQDTMANSFYAGTSLKSYRTFPYIKKYPAIFNQNNSTAIHAITQDSLGRIWAGSYAGSISIIDSESIQNPAKEEMITFLPHAISFSGHQYFISENVAQYGLLQFDNAGHKKSILKNVSGFFHYLSPDQQRYYFGTATYKGLWQSSAASVTKGKPEWNVIDSTKGLLLQNIITITEDTLHRVWAGRGLQGWAVYDPKQQKATTWLIDKRQTDFGAHSSCTDSYGTVWLGSLQRGLQYYEDYSKQISPQNVHRLQHPLLANDLPIYQLLQWQHWLVIGTSDKVLLLDLNAWHQQHIIILRYLNPQEAAFTAALEQNTILQDRKDSSIWFATSDMLYQWDIKKWLALPVYSVHPNLVLHQANKEITLSETTKFNSAPTENTLDFSIWFQSPDNMPRYMSASFIKQGDTLVYPKPSLQTNFSYNNLAPGNYQFCLQIYQSNGAISQYQYNITIHKFWWQYWWVWCSVSLLCIGVISYILLLRKKRAIAIAANKQKEAEIIAIKAAQEKRLANMQVVTLSSQFRPHFILNTLNTIGAQMDDKPEAEIVISRLGESINLIFNHAQQQKIAHSLSSEWLLLKNLIYIHQLMYLKDLQVNLPADEVIEQLHHIQVPLGLLQIPVENALLHGLSNRESSPWLLTITIQQNDTAIMVTITDNGVGRKKAALLTNYHRHGTGTKNLQGILDIVNKQNSLPITILYTDDVFTQNNQSYGTTVSINIPSIFTYEV